MLFMRKILQNAKAQIEKARRSPRLVPKIITVRNDDGTIFQKRVWVLPSEIKKESYSMVQPDLFQDEDETEQPEAGDIKDKEQERQTARETSSIVPLAKPIKDTQFRDYGSWSSNGKHLGVKEREKINAEVADLVTKRRDTITEEDKEKIRRYSGFGGIQADERGVLYDFYTSPPLARAMWQIMNKIRKIQPEDKVLEPSCGTGVFFDVAPKEVKCTGVELDARSAAVAAILQPDVAIKPTSYEVFNLYNQDKFEYVIGNAPFGDRSVEPSFIDMPEEKSLDRYFVSRSIDNLAQGGVLAMIVHPGVLENNLSRDWRAQIIRQAQFMGAVKLPNKSFKHTQTAVQPIILLFRKYPDAIAKQLAAISDEEMQKSGFWHDAWVNGTYEQNVIGDVLEGKGNWGSDVVQGDLTPEVLDELVKDIKIEPEKTTDDASRLANIAMQESDAGEVPTEVPRIMRVTESEADAIAAKTLTVGMTKSENGRLYRLNENHRWELVPSASEIAAEKMQKVTAIASIVQTIRENMQAGKPVDELQMNARSLIQEYEKKYNTTPAEDKDIRRVLREHAAVAGVYEGLLNIDADVLTKPNIYEKNIEVFNGNDPVIDALLTLQKNMVEATVDNVRHYFPNEAESLITQMMEHKDVFLTPEGSYELREDFISGEVWEKIQALKDAIDSHPDEKWEKERKKWEYGIQEIQKAIKWTPIEDAQFSPQSSWIPESIINDWIHAEDGLNTLNRGIYGREIKQVARNKETGKWGAIAERNYYNYNRETGETEVTPEGSWLELADPVIYFLNNQKQRSKYNDTEAYNRKTLDNFLQWVANHENVRDQIELLYNKTFNNYIAAPTKTYEVKIDGWNPNITLGKHQWQTIHHLYRQGKGISALGTGFGKTLAAIGLVGILRQEGKARRVMIQVPNNKVKDWVKAFGKAMPKLKVRAVDPETKGYGDQVKRYAMYQDIANSDSDVIILPESAASEIQLSPEHDDELTEEFVQDQVVETAKMSARKKEIAKEKARSSLHGGKKNKTITFEDFGADALVVDEAHNYKNLFVSSLSREVGMNDGRRSDRAMSLFKKSMYLQKQKDGKNVFMLTATPLTNSPLEYYNMLMHIAPEELKRLGLKTIDDFISNFADITVGPKYEWASGEVKEGKILKGFRNLQALQNIFFKYTDLQNDPDAIGLKKPSANNVPHILPKEEQQADVIKGLAKEVENYRNMDSEQREKSFPGQNFLTFYAKLRTASLDLELYNPHKYKGWVNPKLETLAQNAYESYKSTGGGQVIFCDRVLSGDGSFNMHEKIKQRLIAQGFTDSEIVIVNGLTKSGTMQSDQALEREVSQAIDGYNSGKYKVIIGTTQTLGEGVNLQKNSAALHHLDIPFRPSDFTQRNGRVDRQGNKQDKVALHTYMAAGTIDSYSIALVQGKANWIDQLLKTKSNIFFNPNDGSYIDADELLLALTQEFGGEEAVRQKREEIQKQKTEALQKANLEKVHSLLGAYSTLRYAVRTFNGDKGSIAFQNRMRKLREIEDTLRSNPEFKHLDLLDDDAPDFVYQKDTKTVYRMGDMLTFKRLGGAFKVVGIDHKTNTLQLQQLLQGIDGPDTASIKLDSEDASRRYYASGEEMHRNHFARPSETDIAKFQSLGNINEFIKQDKEFKEQNFDTLFYTLPSKSQYSDSARVPYFVTESYSNSLKGIVRGNELYGSLLNPYKKEDQETILSSMKDVDNMDDTAANILDNPVYLDAMGEELKKTAKEVYDHSKEKPLIEQAVKNANGEWVRLDDFVTEKERAGYLDWRASRTIPVLLKYAQKYEFAKDLRPNDWAKLYFREKQNAEMAKSFNGYRLVIRYKGSRTRIKGVRHVL
jgi:N12 class adenine-specific DNA methylase